MGLFSRNTGEAWTASTRRANSGTTFRAYVNADVLGPGYSTRREARRAAKREAGRLNEQHKRAQG